MMFKSKKLLLLIELYFFLGAKMYNMHTNDKLYFLNFRLSLAKYNRISIKL